MTGWLDGGGRQPGPDARDLGLSDDVSRPVPDAWATPTPVDVPVIFEDDILLVVDKPAGLATMPRGRYVARSVVAQVRWARGDRRIVAAHRLDRLTSGVLVLVKDPAWRAPVQVAFERRSAGLGKEYLARTGARLVHSDYVEAVAAHLPDWTPPAVGECREVTLPLLKRRGVWQTRIDAEGKPARTRLVLTDEGAGVKSWTLTPLTGATHQLRVTLAAVGHPILGDPLYPRVSEEYTSDAGDGARMFLHAHRLWLPPLGAGVRWPVFEAPAPWA